MEERDPESLGVSAIFCRIGCQTIETLWRDLSCILNCNACKEQIAQSTNQHKTECCSNATLPDSAIGRAGDIACCLRGQHGDHKEEEDHDRTSVDQHLH